MKDMRDEDVVGQDYHDFMGGNASGICPPPLFLLCPFRTTASVAIITTVFWSQVWFGNSKIK